MSEMPKERKLNPRGVDNLEVSSEESRDKDPDHADGE